MHTRATLRRWNANPWRRRSARGRSARSRSPRCCSPLTWIVAATALPDPTAVLLPRRDPPRDAARLRLPALPQRPRARAARAGLRRRLHRRLAAADRGAGLHGLRAQLARPRRAAGDRLRRRRDAVLARAPRPTRSATAPPTLAWPARHLARAAARRLLPHALPELFALFLPLAAWSIASRRGAWDELLAATFATTAIAVPLLCCAAAIETWVTPSLLRGLTG